MVISIMFVRGAYARAWRNRMTRALGARARILMRVLCARDIDNRLRVRDNARA